MRKSEIVKKIVEKTGIDKAQVEHVVEAFMSTVEEQVAAGEAISFRRFGTFTVKKRKAKIARNINKNTPLFLPEHYIPWFKPSQNFADRVKSVKVSAK